MDIKARVADVAPSAVVVVATVRALKMHGGVAKDQLKEPNVEALAAGVANLRAARPERGEVRHHPGGGDQQVRHRHRRRSWTGCWTGARRRASRPPWPMSGAAAGAATAGTSSRRRSRAAIDAPHTFRHLYPLEMSVEDKIRTIVQEVYGADGVDFSVPALKRLAEIEKNGWSGIPGLHGENPVLLHRRRHAGSAPRRASPSTSATSSPRPAPASSWPSPARS